MTAREYFRGNMQLGTCLRRPVCKVRTACGEGIGGTFNRVIFIS